LKRKNKQFKAKDKIIQKNSRDGLIEENLSKGTTTNISNKIQDIDIAKLKESDKEKIIDYTLNKEKNNYKKPQENLNKKDKSSSNKNAIKSMRKSKNINHKSEAGDGISKNKVNEYDLEDELYDNENLSKDSNTEGIEASKSINDKPTISKTNDKKITINNTKPGLFTGV